MAKNLISQQVKEVAIAICDRGQRTPFRIIDLDGIELSASEFMSAARDYFESFTIAYSYKTNNVKAVGHLLGQLGCAADVVSGCELLASIEDGTAKHGIYFNGPLKSDDELSLAILHGAIVHIDSIEELKRFCELCRRRGKKVEIGLRLSHFYRDDRRSRFGLSPTEIRHAEAVLKSFGSTVRLAGIHLHVGSNVASTQTLIATMQEYWPFIQRALPSDGYIDIGGGFPANTFHPTATRPPLRQFFQEISTAIERLCLPRKPYRIVMEPGRCLVEDQGYIVGKISHVKDRGDRIAFGDIGINQVSSFNRWLHQIEPMSFESHIDGVTISGPNCFENDVLSVSSQDGIASKDGHFIISGCGGYDLGSTNVWIRADISIWGIRGNSLSLIRRAQNQSEFRDRDIMPESSLPKHIEVGDGVFLTSASEQFADSLHAEIDMNRERLCRTLHWPRFVRKGEDTLHFLQSCEENISKRKEAVYLLCIGEEIAGVVSFNEIDITNQTGYIGYWLSERFIGKGLVVRAVEAMMFKYAELDLLHRFVIKVSTENLKSQAVAERLKFAREGVLSRGERIGETFHDQLIYARIL